MSQLNVGVQVKLLPHCYLNEVPKYQTSGAAGVDLVASVYNNCVVQPHGIISVPTGIAVAIPQGFEGQIRPRSGLARKDGVTVLNAPGTIDSDYRGEIEVVLINHSPNYFTVHPGDRIAQLVICPVKRAVFELVDELDTTERGEGGFGSTGVSAAETDLVTDLVRAR